MAQYLRQKLQCLTWFAPMTQSTTVTGSAMVARITKLPRSNKSPDKNRMIKKHRVFHCDKNAAPIPSGPNHQRSRSSNQQVHAINRSIKPMATHRHDLVSTGISIKGIPKKAMKKNVTLNTNSATRDVVDIGWTLGRFDRPGGCFIKK